MNQKVMTVPGYKFEHFHSSQRIDLYYYPEIKLMQFVWKIRTIGEEYKVPFNTGLKYAETHETRYFLSDLREQGIVGPDDRKWFQEVALPRAIELGLTKAAAISDGNAFKVYYMNLIIKMASSRNLPTRLFNELESACQWLLDDSGK